MVRRIGAVVALVCISLMFVGGIFLATPMGKKTVNFIDDIGSSSSIQGMKSPGDLAGCVMAKCGVSATSMSLFP